MDCPRARRRSTHRGEHRQHRRSENVWQTLSYALFRKINSKHSSLFSLCLPEDLLREPSLFLGHSQGEDNLFLSDIRRQGFRHDARVLPLDETAQRLVKNMRPSAAPLLETVETASRERQRVAPMRSIKLSAADSRGHTPDRLDVRLVCSIG